MTICSSKLVGFYESLLWRLLHLEWLTYQQHLYRSGHPSKGHGWNPSSHRRRDWEQERLASWHSLAGRKQKETWLVLTLFQKESKNKRVFCLVLHLAFALEHRKIKISEPRNLIRIRLRLETFDYYAQVLTRWLANQSSTTRWRRYSYRGFLYCLNLQQ